MERQLAFDTNTLNYMISPKTPKPSETPNYVRKQRKVSNPEICAHLSLSTSLSLSLAKSRSYRSRRRRRRGFLTEKGEEWKDGSEVANPKVRWFRCLHEFPWKTYTVVLVFIIPILETLEVFTSGVLKWVLSRHVRAFLRQHNPLIFVFFGS